MESKLISEAIMSHDMYILSLDMCGILTSVDTDEPLQPPFKLRISNWCSVST